MKGAIGVAILCAMGCVTRPPSALLEGAREVAVVSEGAPSSHLHARGRLGSALRGAGWLTADILAECSNDLAETDFAGIGLVLCAGLAATVGGIGGGVSGALRGLPQEAVRDINEALDAYVRDHSLREEFARVLLARAAPHRALSDADPDLLLVVDLRRVRLRQHAGAQLSLALEARVKLQFLDPALAKRRSYRRSYRYASRPQPVEAWLARQGAGAAEQVESSLVGLANAIVRDLWLRSRSAAPAGRRVHAGPVSGEAADPS